MKKKQNSLLDQLKQENNTIDNSAEILRDIEDCYLEPNTELKRRIEEIWDLQKKADSNSAEKINQLLEEKFTYSYPFDYKVVEKNIKKVQIRTKSMNSAIRKELKVTDNLKNHIFREDKLNNTIKTFNEYVDLVNSIADTGKADDNLFTYTRYGIFGIVLLFFLINSLSFWSIVLGLIAAFFASIFLVIPVVWFANIFYFNKKNKEDLNNLNRLLLKLETMRSEIN